MILVSSVAQGMFLVLFVLFALGPLQGSDADVGLLPLLEVQGVLYLRRRDRAAAAPPRRACAARGSACRLPDQ
ncbi:MAG: hypothetical protein ACK5IN_07870 [Microbacterium sp.]|uniref:hypothetical protein n=1 Tax=Microbacterium sp. TaxID=51671 RepID=UPI003A837751